MDLIYIYTIAGIIAGTVAGFFLRKKVIENKISSAEDAAAKIINESKKEAETIVKEAKLQAKEELYRTKAEFEKESRNKKFEMQKLEKRLTQREENLEKRVSLVDQKEIAIAKREKTLTAQEKTVQEKDEHYTQALEDQKRMLERISGMTSEEAKKLLMQSLENEAKHESARTIRRIEEETKENSDKIARNIIAIAIQRYSADYVAEKTVSVVALPNDEMKGRIIGREGRNIRAIEQITGVDLIIDDTPEAVTISSFDPVRREIARLALEKLILDGRIHPARIEEMVTSAKSEVEATILAEGEQAIHEVGLPGLHPELVKLLGRLKYRFSYGQNVLRHSTEVAHLSGMIAAELGVRVDLAKRAGLLHDLGKAVDFQVEGPHAKIGADIVRQWDKSVDIVNAIAEHHNETGTNSILGFIVSAADALSGGRPGARRESLEYYLKRLESLESVANSFAGVEKSFAIQAGREVRIMVKPNEVDDLAAMRLVRDIVKKIEETLEYPGQIKVTVIRETRAVDYAK